MTDQEVQHAILEEAYNVMKQKGSIGGAIFFCLKNQRLGRRRKGY